MPLKSGLDASIDILNSNPESKIIFASADLSIKDKAISAGAKIFVEKPFDIAILINTIKNMANNL